MTFMAELTEEILETGELPAADWDINWGEVLLMALGVGMVVSMLFKCRRQRRYNQATTRLRRVSELRNTLEARTLAAERAAERAANHETDGNMGGSDGVEDNAAAEGGLAGERADVEVFASDHCPICMDPFPSRSGAGGVGAGADQREGVATLLCGHQFCTNCIVEVCHVVLHSACWWLRWLSSLCLTWWCLRQWLRSNSTCPVCRASQSNLPGVGKTQTRQGGGVQQQQYTRQRPLVDRALLEYELLRVHTMYPDVVTRSQVRRWQSPSFTRRFETDPSFLAAAPDFGSSSGTSGGGGSSSSWGGGSSFGGGGGGTSW